MLVIGIDPGKSTGLVCLHLCADDSKSPAPIHRVLVSQTTPDATIELLHAILTCRHADEPTAIACERYILLPGSYRKTPQYDALHLIGQLREVVAQYHMVKFTLQAPVDALRVLTAAHFKKLKLHTPPKEIHALNSDDVDSAMRHAIYYIATHHARHFTKFMTSGLQL